MEDSTPLLLGLTITSYILLFANITLFATFSILGLNTGLVVNTLENISTIALIVTYTTWTVVYAYQVIWVIYALILVSRRRPGDLILLSSISLGFYVLAQVLQLIVNTVFLAEVSFPFLLGITVSLSLALIHNYTTLFKNRFSIVKQNLQKDDSLVRGLFQNGLDIYALWAFISALLNFSVILKTRINPPINPTFADVIIFVIFITVNFLYVMTDLTVFDKFSRYTLSPYFLRIFVVAALLPITANVGLQILEILVLAFTVASLTGKFTIISTRRKTRPLIPSVTNT